MMMPELLLAIATLCLNHSTKSDSLKLQLDCQTAVIKCALKKDELYDYYYNLPTEVLECLAERKQK